MAETFLLDLVTPEKTLYSGTVQTVVVPGLMGEFGVLPGHANMLAELTLGRLAYQTDTGETVVAVAGGFADVTGEKVTILLDDAVNALELDVNELDSEISELEVQEPSPEDEQFALWQEKLNWKKLCKDIATGEK